MNNNYFFDRIEGYDLMQGEIDDEGNVTVEPEADTLSGLTVVDDLTLEVTLDGPFAGFDDARLHRLLPDRPGVPRRHRGVRRETHRQRSLPDRRVAAGPEHDRQQVGGLHARRDPNYDASSGPSTRGV